MARARLFERIENKHGDIAPGTLVYVYQSGTTTVISDTMKDAASGGNTLTNPLTVGTKGKVEAFADSPGTHVPGYVTLSYTDPDTGLSTTQTASFIEAGATGSASSGLGVWNITEAPPQLWVSRQASAAGDSAIASRGRQDTPYLTPTAAYTALPLNGGLRTGEIHFRPGPPVDVSGGVPGSFTTGTEYHLLSSEFALTGNGIKLIGHGGQSERGGQAYAGTSQLKTSVLLMPDPAVSGATWAAGSYKGLIKPNGQQIELRNLGILNTATTGIPAITMGYASAPSIRNSRLVNVMVTGGAVGLDLGTEDDDNIWIDNCWFSYCTTYGVNHTQHASGSNLVTYKNTTFRWNGSTGGGITPTGADLRIDANTNPWNEGNAIHLDTCKFFGGSYAIDFHGAHSVLINTCQFEMATLGDDAATAILDRSVCRFLGGTGSGASVDGWNHNITFDTNYFHTNPDTTGWTAATPVFLDVSLTKNLEVRNSQWFVTTSRLTTANRLVRLASSTLNNTIDLTQVSDLAGRSTVATDPLTLVQDAGQSNNVTWSDPAGF